MGTCPVRCQSGMTVLENSPEPETPSSQESFIVSLYNYPSFGHTKLTMYLGERLIIIYNDGDYMMVKSASTNRNSYIPTSYTAKVTHRWLFTGISRNKAEELLLQPQNQNGTFLIRDSETKKDCYSLSILCRTDPPVMDSVKHYCISLLQNGLVYISPSRTFSSLQNLVEHYSECADGLCCQLTQPCFLQGLDGYRESRTEPVTGRTPPINWKNISRSVIFRRNRTGSGNLVVSEGLREAITSYLEITEDSNHCCDS